MSSLPLNSSTHLLREALNPEVIRRSANYHPSVWGDQFLLSAFTNMEPNPEVESRVRLLKAEVRRKINNARTKSVEEIVVVDALQRLGLAYHFEDEIKEAIDSIYTSYINNENDDDLNTVALRFRLLRQQGYHVLSDVFKKFKEKDGEFKVTPRNDAKAMLCLYEASHLRVNGENILEEALAFSSKQLKSMLDQDYLSSPLSDEIKHSLRIPLHKGMPRLLARQYISVYEAYVAPNDLLLELAKLDFNLLQALHQRELSDLSRWWKDLDFATKLPFARDRLVECYFWILGVYFEPKYSTTRKFMTKIIALASVIDDIYDVYGTLEELQLFTDAIERWEVEVTNDLPEYMQVCLLALLDVVKEVEDNLTDEERSYQVYYAKEAMKGLVGAYFVEAKWFNTGYVPTFREYLDIAVMSSGYPMLAVQSLLDLGEVATKDAFDWMIKVPKIVRSSALIARLLDDIQTHKVEQQRGDAPSGVQCYMREHDVSEEEACEKIREMINIAWKDINEEIQKPNRLASRLLLSPLNFARMMEVLYKDGDGYTSSNGRTKDIIASLLVHPVQI